MPADLTTLMAQWRDGMLSDIEILGYLHNALGEVLIFAAEAERKDSDKRFTNSYL